MKEIPKEFAELKPALDDNNVVRLGGRLKFADRLPYGVRCPALLPGNSYYAKRPDRLHPRV